MGIMSLIVPKQSEVTDINKQKFLPELGRLLTFMVEEDRQTALAMYSRLFDDAEDEQLLQNLLESPTRQAVVIARAYDAKERKKQLESPTHGEEQTPGFVLAIDRLYQQVAPRHLEMAEPEEAPAEEPAPVVNQFSLFEDDAHPIDDSEYVPFQIEADTVPIAEPVEELPVEPELSAPAEEEAAEGEEELPAAEPRPEEEAPLPEEEEPQDLAEAVFGEASAPAQEQSRQEEPVEEPAEPSREQAPAAESAPPAPAELDLDYIPETKRKAKVFLLILYVLLAVPVTLAGIILLLIPTVLVLAVSLLVIGGGSAVLIAAFSGFPKLADILIVVGTAVIVLALGLLLLWLFVWFIGGAIGGLIRNVIELGRKWCYEEVPV